MEAFYWWLTHIMFFFFYPNLGFGCLDATEQADESTIMYFYMMRTSKSVCSVHVLIIRLYYKLVCVCVLIAFKASAVFSRFRPNTVQCSRYIWKKATLLNQFLAKKSEMKSSLPLFNMLTT